MTFTVLTAATVGTVNWYQQKRDESLELQRIRVGVTEWLDEADQSRKRAALGGPTSKQAFVDAQTAVARAQSLLADKPNLDALQNRLQQTVLQIQSDRDAFTLVQRLNDARERGTQVELENLRDAFGRTAGLQKLSEAYADFGVQVVATPPGTAAAQFAACPEVVHPKLIESLDFILNEDPLGSGLYLHADGGRLTVAEVVDHGAADQLGLIRTGDRLIEIDGIDLVASFTAEEIRWKAYQLLTKGPGQTTQIRLVRDLGQPMEVTLQCKGEKAQWAFDVLEILDPDSVRSRIRAAILTSDLPTLIQLSSDDRILQQPPFTLIQLSGALFLLERSNRSIRFLQVAQQKHPQNFWANHYLGTALSVAHDPPMPDESLRYLTAAVALRPGSVGARMNLVQGLVRAGDDVAAKQHAKVAASLVPEDAAMKQHVESLDLKFDLEEPGSDSLRDSPALPRQVQPNRDFNASSPKTVDEYEVAARRLSIAGDRGGALQLAKQAASQFPDDARVRRIQGVVLLDLGDIVAARIALSDAARRLPGDAASRFYYGIALQYSGDSLSAIHEYEAALQLRPDYQAVRDALEQLREVVP